MVQNVIPGMQAAFIDIGESVNAFLPFTEITGFDVLNNEPFSIDKDKNKNSSDKKINLVVGDELLNVDDKWVEIKSIELFDDEPEQTVHNFYVTGNNTYYADGLLAHNRGH